MPIARYEIRNEYSLTDLELYREADKDDPEALLEGVAMAGLVGVLRQLGDLAEFAAEIFHNLHEEVMATAARGHGLMVRVLQVETEIPSIERAFLPQTDHSSFFYHAGIDWHRNLRLDQNLITQGDLPRFVMDSYEECRAPPRLFLLDKFDVAGAGACLKRYTNPSFFKVETSETISADFQREKKIHKIKKKGPRWRNGEAPEVLPTHAKLHQLFLAERVESGVGRPSFRAKLKRKLNGFPFDSKTGKSYMEKLLKSPSPDHEVLNEVTMNSSPFMTGANDHKESGYEIFEVREVSPDKARWARKRSPPSFPDGEENMLNPSIYGPYNPPEGDREESLTGYQSDDSASEIDNFVDAPTESEMDVESELRMKSDITTSSHIKNESSFSDADEEHLHASSSDSQSPGDSTMSYDGNNSSTKEMSSFSSDSPSNSVENPQAENSSAEVFQCADVVVNEMVVDASSYQETANGDFQVEHQSKPVVSDEDVTKENKANLVIDPLHSPYLYGFDSQSEDDSLESTAGEHLVDEESDVGPPFLSIPEIYRQTVDSSGKRSSDLLHEDESDRTDQDLIDDAASTSDMLHDLSTNNTPDIISSKNLIPGKLEDEFPEVPENSPSDYHVTAHNWDNIELSVSKEDRLSDVLDDEDSNDSTGSANQFPQMLEASLEKKLDETSLTDGLTVNVEDDHSNSSTDNQIRLDKKQELFNRSVLENNAPHSLHPGEINSVSASSPINRHQTLGYPKDPLDSVFPPISPFSETNQTNLSDTPPLPPLPPVGWRMGKFQPSSSSTDGEIMRPKEVSPPLISPLPLPLPSDSVRSRLGPTSTDDVSSSQLIAPTNDVNSSLEEIKHSPIETSPEIVSKEENVGNSCSRLDSNTLHENKEQEIVKPIAESASTSLAEEDGANGSRTLKLPRAGNPLVDDVAILDKSKLRKVAERVRPEIQKADARDSFLEQIRTKSFNLRPATASRPSIRGPNTNLKVAAILEKANAIRQAFAGSDEDYSDSWSDS